MAPKMCYYVGKYLIKAKNVHLLVKKHVGLNLKPKIEKKPHRCYDLQTNQENERSLIYQHLFIFL